MKPAFLYSMLITLALLFSGASLYADGEKASVGIGLRGSYWNMIDGPLELRLNDHWHHDDFHTGGFGGNFFFFSRVQERLYLDFSLGGLIALVEHEDFYDGEYADLATISPFLFGVRVDLLPMSIRTNLRPYVSAGAGLYVLSDIQVWDYHYYDEDVEIRSTGRPGVYAGVGTNIMLSDNFGFNYDIKYHWIDLRDSYEEQRFHNGFEFGFGVVVVWGDFKKR